MGIFRKAGNALARFMYGRNGVDQLNQALVWLYLALFGLELICANVLKLGLAARLFESVGFAVMIFVLFRMFSKNLYKRRAENQKWVNWLCRIKSSQKGAMERHADKEHRYFTCKSCKTICRVPAGKGKIVITCPKCGAQIQART